MRLSEMDTAQLADALLDMAEPVRVICMDEDAAAMLKELADMRGQPVIAALGTGLSRLLPLLLEKHRGETLLILETLTGHSGDAILARNGLETAKEVMACVDDELLDFFTCAGDMARRLSRE